MLSKPSPIGPQCVQQAWVAPTRKGSPQEGLSPNVNTLNELWKVEKRLNRSSRQDNDGGTNSAQPANHEVKNKGHIVIPYTQGLCESIKKICGRYGIQTHFKGDRTIKNLLVSPKGKDPMVNLSGAIYWYQCGGPRLGWWIHRGNLQDLWWKIQRAPKAPLCHSLPQQPNRPHH